MQPGLYRQAAIRARADRLFGVSLDSGADQGRALSLASALFLLALFALVTFTDYATHATATGILTTAQANLVHRAPRNGLVRALQVSEGQLVQPNELILKLDPNRTGSNLASQEQDLALSAKRQYLAALDASSLLDQQQQLEHEQLKVQRRAALSQRKLLTERHQYLQDQLSVQQAALARLKALQTRKLISLRDVSERRLAVLQTQQSLASVSAQIQEQKDQETLLDLQLEAATVNARHQLLESRTLEDSLGSAWLQAKSLADLGVVASVAGRVSAIEVRAGQQVQQGEPLFTLLPDDARYLVQLDVSGRVIAKLRLGMPVRLRFDAFPWQKYGAREGTVFQFSAAPRGTKPATQAVWKVLVALKDTPPQEGQPVWTLTPGLRVQADIELERQTLLRWMLGPIIETLKA